MNLHDNRSKSHKPVSVKVNAFVDEGIAEVVRVLNEIKMVSTFSSCVGVNGDYAHIYFTYGCPYSKGWLKTARFSSRLAKLLSTNNECYDCDVLMEWTGDKDSPFVALSFPYKDSAQLFKILDDHRSELAYDT